MRHLHAHGLIAKLPRTRRVRVTNYGRNVTGTTICLREHLFPNVYAGLRTYALSFFAKGREVTVKEPLHGIPSARWLSFASARTGVIVPSKAARTPAGAKRARALT